MKTKRKLWLISFMCIGIGAAILAAGLFLGGKPGFYIDSSGIYPNDTYKDKKVITKKQELEAFDSMELSLGYADFEIIPSDKYAIEYCVEGGRTNPVCKVKDGKLIFQESKAKFNVVFGFSMEETLSTDYYVKVYVPSNQTFSSVLLDAENGTITLPSFKADSLKIVNDYGDTILKDFEGRSFTADIENGDLTSNKILADTIKVTNEYGDIKLGSSEGNSFTAELENGLLSSDFIHADSIRLQNEYGDIGLNQVQGQTFTAEVENGKISVQKLDCEETAIQNEYGDVYLGLIKTIENYDLDLAAEYGIIQMPGYEVSSNGDEAKYKLPNTSGQKIKVTCENGDIILTSK